MPKSTRLVVRHRDPIPNEDDVTKIVTMMGGLGFKLSKRDACEAWSQHSAVMLKHHRETNDGPVAPWVTIPDTAAGVRDAIWPYVMVVS
ncbi:hypothetical protein ACOI1H_21505 [Loktanella sp. DJP18]|uniref:hypothetical protein n=1 Tax=Loktanella sp. DJP18 TaxID=3409788 RepID=UPI003BB6C813